MITSKRTAKTILIVEDDRLNQRLFRDVLQAAGHNTISVDNCVAAIDAARVNKPDLIMLDIRLGSDYGLDAARILKRDRRTGATPIIAVTASTSLQEKAAASAAGCIEYLIKPVSISTLLATVSRHLSASAARGRLQAVS